MSQYEQMRQSQALCYGSAVATIDLANLRHNAQCVRAVVGTVRILAIIKANAYGHGLLAVAKALANSCDGFGVAHLQEALLLRHAGLQCPVLVLQGVFSAEQLQAASENNVSIVIHDPEQLARLQYLRLLKPVDVWCKINTGMHRLGFDCQQYSVVTVSYTHLTLPTIA